MWKGKTILVGVTGGIAAYKAASLTSKLKSLGAKVEVVMTRNAVRFITPLTLQVLSENAVHVEMFEPVTDYEVEHISLATRADLILIAPATANILGKVANGIADDLLSTVIMATKAPVVFAPAMNVNMYENPIVQENIAKLKGKGYHFIEPEEGRLACGYRGKGRLANLQKILTRVEEILQTSKERKKKAWRN